MISIEQDFNVGDWVQLEKSAHPGLSRGELARVTSIIDRGSRTVRVKTLCGKVFPIFALFETTGRLVGGIDSALNRGAA